MHCTACNGFYAVSTRSRRREGPSDRLKTLQPLACSPALRTKSMWVLYSCGDAIGLVFTYMRCALLTLVFSYGNRMAVPVRSAGKHLGL